MYVLVNGIYPDWAIFVSTFSSPTDPKKKKFAKYQEKVRKDIECAFGVLVQRFHILQRPLRNWFLEEIVDLLKACVILHNMTVEARRVDDIDVEDENTGNGGLALFGRRQVTAEEADTEGIELFAARVAAFETAMQSSYEHFLLKNDRIKHINATRN